MVRFGHLGIGISPFWPGPGPPGPGPGLGLVTAGLGWSRVCRGSGWSSRSWSHGPGQGLDLVTA